MTAPTPSSAAPLRESRAEPTFKLGTAIRFENGVPREVAVCAACREETCRCEGSWRWMEERIAELQAEVARLTDARAATATETMPTLNDPAPFRPAEEHEHVDNPKGRAAATSAEPVAWMLVAQGESTGQPYGDEAEAEHAAEQWQHPHRVVPLYSHPAPQVAALSGCPCTLVEPCSEHCSCAHPSQSGGCQRCATYGSQEQRVAAATRLASLSEDDALDVAMFEEQSHELNRAKVTIARLESQVASLSAALEAATKDADAPLLIAAIEQSLAPCIVEDDVAAVAIYEQAIAEAGVAISTADDALHTIRAAISRDLARKHNRYLATICTLIDGIWEESVTFARLHETRRALPSGDVPR